MGLTKAEVEELVREGIGKTEEVEANEIKEGATLEVRGLTKGEVNQINALLSNGQTFTAGLDGELSSDAITIDLAKAATSSDEADDLTAKFGLSVGDSKWSARDIQKLPPALVSRVAKKARELTPGDSVLEDVASFRGVAGRKDAVDRDS